MHRLSRWAATFFLLASISAASDDEFEIGLPRTGSRAPDLCSKFMLAPTAKKYLAIVHNERRELLEDNPNLEMEIKIHDFDLIIRGMAASYFTLQDEELQNGSGDQDIDRVNSLMVGCCLMVGFCGEGWKGPVKQNNIARYGMIYKHIELAERMSQDDDLLHPHLTHLLAWVMIESPRDLIHDPCSERVLGLLTKASRKGNALAGLDAAELLMRRYGGNLIEKDPQFGDCTMKSVEGSQGLPSMGNPVDVTHARNEIAFLASHSDRKIRALADKYSAVLNIVEGQVRLWTMGVRANYRFGTFVPWLFALGAAAFTWWLRHRRPAAAVDMPWQRRRRRNAQGNGARRAAQAAVREHAPPTRDADWWDALAEYHDDLNELAEREQAMYLCPIIREIMIHPAILVETGNIFEHENVYRWVVAEKKRQDPQTGQSFTNPQIVPVASLRREIRNWCEEQAERMRRNNATPHSTVAEVSAPTQIHIFVDASNIELGARSARAGPVPIDRLTQFVKRGRSVQQSVVVGSASLRELEWRTHGYETHKDPRRGREIFVDEALQAQIMSTARRTFQPPRVLALLTGDGNQNGDRTTFLDCVEAALQHGWHVEVCSWQASLHRSYLAFAEQYPGRVLVRYLEDACV